MSLLSLISASLFFLVHSAYEKIHLQSEMIYSTRRAVEAINKDFKAAKEIRSLANGARIEIVDIQDNKLTYYVQNNNLYRHAQSKLPVAENIYEIKLEELENNCWELSVTAAIKDERYEVKRIVASRIF